jgi:hypothetical protein
MFELLFTLFLFQAPKQPVQPIAFSHKLHAGDLKLKCKMCHPGTDETMQIAKSATCMQCHSAIKTDSPDIQKLAKGEIHWVRVYEIPSYVSFSHKVHLDSGNTCQDCHGPVAERTQLAKEGDISMGGCMNCHRLKKVSIDCSFCHEQR